MSAFQRPNYFIGVQIPTTTPLVQSSLGSIYETLSSRNLAITKFLTKPAKLHLTLCLLHIEEGRVQEAIQCFANTSDEFETFIRGNNNIEFSRINAFGAYNRRNVIWLEPRKDVAYNSLIQYGEHIKYKFEANNFQCKTSDVLHATVAKIGRSKKRVIISESDYSNIDDIVGLFPPIQYTSIELLKIGSTDPSTGFYQSLVKLEVD